MKMAPTLPPEKKRYFGSGVRERVAEWKKEKRERQDRAVDVSIAKNSATRRAAEDYHRLTDREFAGKYKASKKTFARRYRKTKGDTYTAGLKKQARAVAYLSRMNGDSWGKTAAQVGKYTAMSKAEQKQLDKGHEFVASMMRSAGDVSINRTYNTNVQWFQPSDFKKLGSSLK